MDYSKLEKKVSDAAKLVAASLRSGGDMPVLVVGPPGTERAAFDGARLFSADVGGLDDLGVQEVSEVYELGGLGPYPGRDLPIRAPHHTASAPGMFGSSYSGRVLPGEVSLAHNGVLVLLDAPEFRRPILEGVGEAFRERVVSVGKDVVLPASFHLILTAVPCPCGGTHGCSCTKAQKEKFLHRLDALGVPEVDLVEITL